MNICMVTDEGYFRYMYVSLVSLFENNKDDSICVYVIYSHISDNSLNELLLLCKKYNQDIYPIHIDTSFFDCLPALNFRKETYYRLLIPDIIPQEVKRILYLDVDVIVMKSLRELYNLDFEGNMIIACQDLTMPILDAKRIRLFKRSSDKRYFNAGVILMDLDSFRRFRIDDYLNSAKELNYDLQYHDQDILNYMFFEKTKYIDGTKYNLLSSYLINYNIKDVEDVVIIHFTNCHPWQVGKKNSVFDIWWNYAQKTPFYVELMKEQLNRLEEAYVNGCDVMTADHLLIIIYELLLHLKGKGIVREYMDNSERKFYIYGAGKVGQEFLEYIEEEKVSNKPVKVIDKAKKTILDYHVLNSVNEQEFDEKCTIIVTPVNNTKGIIKEIQDSINNIAQVVSVEQFLRQILEFGEMS